MIILLEYIDLFQCYLTRKDSQPSLLLKLVYLCIIAIIIDSYYHRLLASGGGSLLNQVGLFYWKENISMVKN